MECFKALLVQSIGIIKLVSNDMKSQIVANKKEARQVTPVGLPFDKAWQYISGIERVTLDEILEVHRILTKNVLPKSAGHIRKGSARDVALMGHRIIHLCVQMRRDPYHYKNDDMREDAVAKAHSIFTTLAPFQRGNAEVAAILRQWHKQYVGLRINKTIEI